MPSSIFVYGGNAANKVVTTYSSDAKRAGFVARQSLISAVSGPSSIHATLPAAITPAAARLVRMDIDGTLLDEIHRVSASLDMLLWDLDDERLGVHQLSNGTFLTRSPQLKASQWEGATIVRDITFGSKEHLELWKQAATIFAERIKSLGLWKKTRVLRLPWSAEDANGDSVELDFGPRAAEANSYFDPYFAHLEDLGAHIILENQTAAASSHQQGRAPQNFTDDTYHRLMVQLAGSADDGKSAAGMSPGPWNWDNRHKAQILYWTNPEQLDSGRPGRTEHVILPRRDLGEKHPLQFLIQNSHSDTLLVVSHGALPRTKYTVPRFEWLDTLRERSENLMFLADTALQAHPDLELAWFTGDASDDLTARYSSVVQEVARQLGCKKILFMGGSGGGFASMALAAATPGSRALVFNPQTIIRKYWNKAVTAYTQTLFPQLESNAGLDRLGQRVSAVSRISAAHSMNYQINYVQNHDDMFHVENHLGPFAAKLGMPATSGLSADGNVQLIVEHFASGHNMPYRTVLHDFIDLTLLDWGSDLRSFNTMDHGHLLIS